MTTDTEALLPLYQDLSDDELELLRELHKQWRADLNEATCFMHGASRKAVPDETLRRMSGRELAAWAQRNNVMVAQLKAHLAERFPEGKKTLRWDP
jgi:hypothetical protein